MDDEADEKKEKMSSSSAKKTRLGEPARAGGGGASDSRTRQQGDQSRCVCQSDLSLIPFGGKSRVAQKSPGAGRD